jgi:Cu-processing system ATP-binding protein
MIEIKEINKKFGKLQVLKNVSLSCQKGECIALIGPNVVEKPP